MISAGELRELLDRPSAAGLGIIVIERSSPEPSPPGDGPEGASGPMALSTALDTAEARLVAIGHGAVAEFWAIPESLRAHWPAAPWTAPFGACLLAVLACALGWLAETAVRRRLRHRRAARPRQEADLHWARLRATASSLAGLALQTLIAVVIFLALSERGTPERDVGYAVILVGCLWLRIGLVVSDLVLSGAGAADAGIGGTASLRHTVVLLVSAMALVSVVLALINRLELGAALYEATRLIASAGFVAWISAELWRERRTITAMGFEDPGSLGARAWPWIATAYLVVALALVAWRVLSGEPVLATAILAPIYCGAIAILAHAFCMALLLERQRPASPAVPQPGVGEAAATETAGPAAAEAGGDRWAAEVAQAIALAVWVAGIALAWKVPLRSGDGGIHGFWAVLLVLLLARLGWIAIGAYFDRRIAEEGPATAGEPGEEGGGKGSRLGTVLPLLRSFLLISVAVIAVMIVLAQFGLNIAPLFAGAGLVGVAVGFGAQSLVRDIFSGLFFLIDDAFRVGEYVETGGVRGTVERISIRSMQLRHQNGPLHTLPFGEITQLTNYSRDWVIMKLPIRVTFETDPERVRKLIKKLGQELMSDPAIGDKFVEPLKSQGVREIDDSGQVIRVKFMTRPGEQFVLRKVVYARIRELFQREGIEFAAREVRVRVTGKGESLSEADAQQVAAAAGERTLNP